MPLISALFVTDVNVITYCPLAFAGTVNCLMLAMFSPCVPLIVTLNTCEPAVVKNVSQKCSRTR